MRISIHLDNKQENAPIEESNHPDSTVTDTGSRSPSPGGNSLIPLKELQRILLIYSMKYYCAQSDFQERNNGGL